MLPLLGRDVFGLDGFAIVLTFLVAFGVTKALSNLAAGALADRFGRRPVLIAGWLIGVPVPLLLIWAPSWAWVVVANVLLGVNQGLTWSTTVTMKIDLVGPTRRGLALGLNEAAGYLAVAATALATGLIAAETGLRPAPFYLGLAFAGLGLGVSVLFVKETRGHVELEGRGSVIAGPAPRWRDVAMRTTWRDRSLSAASQAGLVNNLNDGVAWGLLPVYFAAAGLTLPEIGVLVAAYPAVWGIGQVAIGALSDRVGRKGLIVAGMLLQAASIAAIALATRFRSVARRGRGSRPRYGDGLSDPARSRRRRRGPGMAGIRARRVPALARPRLRDRGDRGGRPRRRCRDPRGDPRGGRVDGRLRSRRPRPDARDAAAPRAAIRTGAPSRRSARAPDRCAGHRGDRLSFGGAARSEHPRGVRRVHAGAPPPPRRRAGDAGARARRPAVTAPCLPSEVAQRRPAASPTGRSGSSRIRRFEASPVMSCDLDEARRLNDLDPLVQSRASDIRSCSSGGSPPGRWPFRAPRTAVGERRVMPDE